jgi:hypothetical protein
MVTKMKFGHILHPGTKIEFAKPFMGMEWGKLHTCLREAHADGGNVLC